MRKLVALLLVLAAAPLASAAMLSFVCPDAVGGKVQADTLVTINVVTDVVANGFNVTIASTNHNVQLGTLNSDYVLATASAGALKDGTKSDIVILKAFAANTAPPFVQPGGIVYSFKVMTGPAGTSFVVNDFKGTNPYAAGPGLKTTINGVEITDTVNGMAALTLNVVPEPATMALLGLGGLLFARRK